MRIAISGAAGLVGSALVARFAPRHDVTALTHRDLDITDARGVSRVMSDLAPEVIVNCAVIGVDECEADHPLAAAVNVRGPELLAAAAERSGGAFVHFSTNYVFAGDQERIYGVDDEARPVNTYGWTKLAGEAAAIAGCARTLIVRTSWVFGHGKDTFLSTAHRKLARGERVRAINDIWASATYVEDLATRVEELIAGGLTGVVHAVNEGVVSYVDFAEEAARLVGADASLIDATSSAGVMRAPRPRYTPMRCDPPIRPWKEALAAYVAAS
jgi:dTDP-4-dehydrorhamnose reductase